MINTSQIYCAALIVVLAFGVGVAHAVSDKYRSLSARLVEDAARQLADNKAGEADALLNLALTSDPSNARAYLLKGEAQRKLDNKEEGLRLISVGLEIEPGDPKALKMHADAALDVGDIEQAEKSLESLQRVCAAPCDAAHQLAEAIDKKRAQEE